MLNLLFALIQSSASSQIGNPSAIDWQSVILAFIAGGGIIVTIITILGNSLLAKQKAANEVHLKRVEATNEAQALRAKEIVANAAAERQQDSDLSTAMVGLIKTTGQFSVLLARQVDILNALATRMDSQRSEEIAERHKLMTGVAIDVLNTSTELVAHREEGQGWVDEIRGDIEKLKEGLDSQVGEIIKQLEQSPDVTAHQETTQQILTAIAGLKSQLENIERRISISNGNPAATPAPILPEEESVRNPSPSPTDMQQ
jgi:hypothetical protein